VRRSNLRPRQRRIQHVRKNGLPVAVRLLPSPHDLQVALGFRAFASAKRSRNDLETILVLFLTDKVIPFLMKRLMIRR